MWKGVLSALTAKFHADETIDFREMERCLKLQIDLGVKGFIINSAIGEGNRLSLEERLEILSLTKSLCDKLPVLFTIHEQSTRHGENAARLAFKSGATALILDPEIIQNLTASECVSSVGDISNAGDLPTFISIDKFGCHAINIHTLEQLDQNPLIVGICSQFDDVRSITTIINRFENRFALFINRDNLAFEALSVGAHGWITGLCGAFGKEATSIYRLMHAQRHAEALELYRWFRPVLDLTASTTGIQNIKLAEALMINSTEFTRRPRKVLNVETRTLVEMVIKECLIKRQEWSND
jgi:1-pyrroline-4-hydroxy-2-carboxylate deaminase